jgi:hypothetical protein
MYSNAWAPSIADEKNAAPIASEFGAGTFEVDFQEDESYDRPPSVSGIKNVRFCFLYFYIISFIF